MHDVLDGIPRRDLAVLPTPIDALDRMSDAIGVEIFVKRDDLTGCVLTGNKARKLEYLLAEAQLQGSDVLVTCGGSQSNHCRSTIYAAASCGLGAHVLLQGNESDPVRGNLLLDRLAGAEITFVTREQYADRKNQLESLRRRLIAEGRRPYVIPEGGSNATGSLGYVQAMREIAVQSKSSGIRFDHIVCAVGSAGTYAGLMAGKELYGFSGKVWGIDVCNDADYFRTETERILDELKKRWFPGLEIHGRDARFIDGYKGLGYGIADERIWRVIRRLATAEGIVLDPTYTAKAWNGMAGLVADGSIEPGSRVLFLHTGGIFSLFGADVPIPPET